MTTSLGRGHVSNTVVEFSVGSIPPHLVVVIVVVTGSTRSRTGPRSSLVLRRTEAMITIAMLQLFGLLLLLFMVLLIERLLFDGRTSSSTSSSGTGTVSFALVSPFTARLTHTVVAILL